MAIEADRQTTRVTSYVKSGSAAGTLGTDGGMNTSDAGARNAIGMTTITITTEACASPGIPTRNLSDRTPTMDKREINSPRLTANYLFWVCGVGGLLVIALLGHYVWRAF